MPPALPQNTYHMTRTRNARRRMAATILLAAGSIAGAGSAQAQSCDSRPAQSHFAREDLRRAVSDGDFATAQDFSDRARRELEQLASIAVRCGCGPAQSRFEAAAAQVHQARDAETRRELRKTVNETIRLFDEAMQALRHCAKR